MFATATATATAPALTRVGTRVLYAGSLTHLHGIKGTVESAYVRPTGDEYFTVALDTGAILSHARASSFYRTA